MCTHLKAFCLATPTIQVRIQKMKIRLVIKARGVSWFFVLRINVCCLVRLKNFHEMSSFPVLFFFSFSSPGCIFLTLKGGVGTGVY